MNIYAVRTTEFLLSPPASPLLLGALAAWLLWRRRRWGWVVFAVAWVGLYLASVPAGAGWLARRLEVYPALSPLQIVQAGAQAIVVLGAARYRDAPEYGGSTSGPLELERLRYAAYLERITGLPLAVMGGDAYETDTGEAHLMTGVLEKEFGVPVRWEDGRSGNTFDNARYAWSVLHPAGVRRIALVTHAWHMRRAKRAFEKEGFGVVPAPTGFSTRGGLQRGWYAWLPQASSLERTQRYLHEFMGMAWYAMTNR